MERKPLSSVYYVVSLLAPLVQNLVSTVAERTLGAGRALAAVLGIGAAMVMLLAVLKALGALLRRRELRADVDFGNRPAGKSKAVIVSFSRVDHAEKLLEYHSPERMVLVATTEGRAASAPQAHQWAEEHRGGGFQVDVVEIKDAMDAAEMERAADAAIKQLVRAHHYGAQEISADITGGTVAMSIGLFAAAVSHRVPVTYMPPKKTDREGRGLELDEPKLVKVTLIPEPSDERSQPNGNNESQGSSSS